MIVGNKVTKAEINRHKDERVSGLNINISLSDVKLAEELLEIKFRYKAEYESGVADLVMEGFVYADEDKKRRDAIAKEWKDHKKLPDDFAEEVINSINYACGAHGTLVARAVNLQPPMMPPLIKVDKSGTGGGSGGSQQAG